MSAKHHKYYPIEVLEKELIQLDAIENRWTELEKQKHSEKFNNLQLNIKQLKASINSLTQLTI